MTLITPELLPALHAAQGVVHFLRSLPPGARLTPEAALALAERLTEAAVQAEGDRRIEEARLSR